VGRERSYDVPADLRQAWEAEAERWTTWARSPGHDSYWRFHRDAFLELLPAPGRLTLDIGCGEGRLGRDLARRGHHVVGIDGAPTLARLAATHDQPQPVAVGDAARLPLCVGCADLVVAFMSLQDIDDVDSAVAEVARVLEPRGRFCLAIVHPLNSAGEFVGKEVQSPFVIDGSYFAPRRYVDHIERDGLHCTFASDHRTIEAFSRALERAGLLIEAIREVTDPEPADRWYRIPLFLQIRAVKP
jgi:SAM-dependent methyltransferase